jgi:hypothetical protein
MSDEWPHVTRHLSHDKKIMLIVAMTFHGKNHFQTLDDKETGWILVFNLSEKYAAQLQKTS